MKRLQLQAYCPTVFLMPFQRALPAGDLVKALALCVSLSACVGVY